MRLLIPNALVTQTLDTDYIRERFESPLKLFKEKGIRLSLNALMCDLQALFFFKYCDIFLHLGILDSKLSFNNKSQRKASSTLVIKQRSRNTK